MADPILKVSVGALNKCLICAHCQGYLIEAHTINECLHTFCKKCIFDALRTGNKHCPVITCRMDLGVNPYDKLIFDRNKQALVDKFFPHLNTKKVGIESKLSENESISHSSHLNPKVGLPGLASDKIKIKILPDFLSFNGVAADLKLPKLLIQVLATFRIQQLTHFIVKQINHPIITEMGASRMMIKCRDRVLNDADYTLSDVNKLFWKVSAEDLEVQYFLSCS